jgi:hypothetical protein
MEQACDKLARHRRSSEGGKTMNSEKMIEALARLQASTMMFYKSGKGLELCRRMSDPSRTANVRQNPEVFTKDNPFGRGRQLQEMVLETLDTINTYFLRFTPVEYQVPVPAPTSDGIVYLDHPIVVDEETKRMIQVISWRTRGNEVLFSTFCPAEAHGMSPDHFGGAPIILVTVAAVEVDAAGDDDPIAQLLWSAWRQLNEHLEGREEEFSAEGYVAGLRAGMDAIIPERPTDAGDEG